MCYWWADIDVVRNLEHDVIKMWAMRERGVLREIVRETREKDRERGPKKERGGDEKYRDRERWRGEIQR